jgi:hypothetical protein
LDHETVIVQDKKLQKDGTRETILIIKFILFESMTLNEYLKFGKLTKELVLIKHHINEVQINGA